MSYSRGHFCRGQVRSQKQKIKKKKGMDKARVELASLVYSHSKGDHSQQPPQRDAAGQPLSERQTVFNQRSNH